MFIFSVATNVYNIQINVSFCYLYYIYKTYYTSQSGIWRDISRVRHIPRVVSYFHEPKAQLSSDITMPYSTTSAISAILDILTIDILEVWITKSIF